ncbi:MAG: tRNA-dihydrouridine synthase family protein [Lachnospiraceae bacterium]|nr:tRNA-dihydrouridine synthase family protein [Lachnospiraceae bacterium]
MKFYFAPMEGVTGYLYRNVHHEFFPDVDRYYTPFIVANQSGNYKNREINDILPENNKGLTIIPQILTNKASDFLFTVDKIRSLGYEEINLNLGCPSGTVVSKGKGSGFLGRKDELRSFFEEVYATGEKDISVKTRIGIDNPDEFMEIMQIYNDYPIKELTIHPRLQKDYYKNTPNLSVFKEALAIAKMPVCYNGDLFTLGDYERFHEQFPEVEAVMVGRGMLADPNLIGLMKNGTRLEKDVLRAFHDRILSEYQQILSGDRNLLFKMKELWFYMIHVFSDDGTYAKKIRKSQRLFEYLIAVDALFANEELIEKKDLILSKN